MEEKTKKIVALSLGGLVLLGGGAALGANLFPKEVVQVKNITVEVPKEVIKTVEVIKEVPVEKIVTKEVPTTVLVDNGKLAEVTKFLNDQYENDLIFNNEDKIVARIDMFNIYEESAKSEITSGLVNELDRKGYLDSDFDDFRKSEVSIRKIYNQPTYDADFDAEEITYTFEVKVTGHSTQHDIDDITKVYKVTVDVLKNTADISDIESV